MSSQLLHCCHRRCHGCIVFAEILAIIAVRPQLEKAKGRQREDDEGEEDSFHFSGTFCSACVSCHSATSARMIHMQSSASARLIFPWSAGLGDGNGIALQDGVGGMSARVDIDMEHKAEDRDINGECRWNHIPATRGRGALMCVGEGRSSLCRVGFLVQKFYIW